MSSGDSVNSMSSIEAAAYLDIQPASGAEWIIHNLLIPDGATGVEVYAYNGTNSILLGTYTSSLLLCNFHCTNTYRIRMKNVGASAIILGYDGIAVK